MSKQNVCFGCLRAKGIVNCDQINCMAHGYRKEHLHMNDTYNDKWAERVKYNATMINLGKRISHAETTL